MSTRWWSNAARGSAAIAAALTLCALPVRSEPAGADAGARLLRAYPDALKNVEDGMLIWRDGTRMPLSDGETGKTFERMLEAPDLDDMFALPYRKGPMAAAPLDDPGRVRNMAFFKKMYGDCTTGKASLDLVEIPWLPEFGGGKVAITRINGVHEKLARVSAELSKLPPEMIRKFLVPHSGTFNCRVIARTNRLSAHGLGIAIDIGTSQSDYWQWSKNGAYRNRIPMEIVEIFERHGFIWGGKWKSFDTMHFEYRPELVN